MLNWIAQTQTFAHSLTFPPFVHWSVLTSLHHHWGVQKHKQQQQHLQFNPINYLDRERNSAPSKSVLLINSVRFCLSFLDRHHPQTPLRGCSALGGHLWRLLAGCLSISDSGILLRVPLAFVGSKLEASFPQINPRRRRDRKLFSYSVLSPWFIGPHPFRSQQPPQNRTNRCIVEEDEVNEFVVVVVLAKGL